MSFQSRLTPVLLSPVLVALAAFAGAQVVTVESEQFIAPGWGGFGGTLDMDDLFGMAVASPGDLDGDGIAELAVGVPGDGAVWILFLHDDGSVKSEQKISGMSTGTFGAFGTSLAALGDFDGDGIGDLAVGGGGRVGGEGGRVWLLFLDSDGTVKDARWVRPTGVAWWGELLGSAMTSIGDLDANGVPDLAVSARGDPVDGSAVWILFLEADGTLAAEQKISASTGGFGGQIEPDDAFGISVASPGDLDGDGRAELAVGAFGDDDGGTDMGAVWMLFLEDDGTVRAERKISATQGGFAGPLLGWGEFGYACAALGDLDGDGIGDLAVGEPQRYEPGEGTGSLWLLFLRTDGTVKGEQRISGTTGGFDNEPHTLWRFAASLAPLGDLDGDGVLDLAAGAPYHSNARGAAWTLRLGACVRLDFETEDDFLTPLVNGQHLDVELGRLVTLASSGPNAGPCIFDSSVGGPNDPSQDPDLLVDTGNVLILQTENFPPDAEDVFPRPNDDEDGGTLSFVLAPPAEIASMRWIDQDASDGTATVVLTDGAGYERTYTLPAGWTGDLLQPSPGQRVLDLTTLLPQEGFAATATAAQDATFEAGNVVRLDVHLAGSGAIDDLTFTPAGMARACARSRNGSGTNPEILGSASRPVLGLPWHAELDCASFGTGIASVSVRRAACTGPMTPTGEVLVAGPLVLRKSGPISGSATTFSFDVPFDLSLLGLELHVQGACRSAMRLPGQGKVLRAQYLSNALDLVIGF